MKAITCPQCGALVKTISPKDKFALCDYCEAKILVPENRDRIVELPDEEKLTPWEQHQENYRKVRERAARYDAPYTNPLPEDRSYVMPLVLGGIALFLIVAFAVSSDRCGSRPDEVKGNSQPATKVSLKPQAWTTPKQPWTTPRPQPKINYEVKVQWSGANDMEHFENPQIDQSKLPSTDENELKKTVFKNRAVQVRIKIDTSGEVSSAEAVSGHPILSEAAVNAARKTLFNSRSKPATRVLTYYFRLKTE